VGLWSRPEAAFARLSLRATYAPAGRIRHRAPALLARPRLRRLLCAQLFAHPERLSPGAVYGVLRVLLDGTGFHAT
ncbi:hypothetical protein, partial [Salmonella enterica]|uniref:hypothetical protein n=1 Tax=Salmonella enterica TaxID=28901 RepID=UPI0019D5660A